MAEVKAIDCKSIYELNSSFMIFKGVVILGMVNLYQTNHVIYILIYLEIIYLGVFIDLSFTNMIGTTHP